MEYDKAKYQKSLLNIQQSHYEICGISEFIINNPSKCDEIVEIWCNIFEMCEQKKRLLLLYILNEVFLSKNKSVAEIYIDSFYPHLADKINKLYETSEKEDKQKINNMIYSWKIKNVFNEERILYLFPSLQDPNEFKKKNSKEIKVSKDIEWIETSFEKIKQLSNFRETLNLKISEFEKKFSEFESSEEADQNDDKFEELYLDVEEASKDYSDYLSELKKSVDEYEILIKQVEECTEKLTSKNEYDINSNNKNRERIKIINKKLEMFENQ